MPGLFHFQLSFYFAHDPILWNWSPQLKDCQFIFFSLLNFGHYEFLNIFILKITFCINKKLASKIVKYSYVIFSKFSIINIQKLWKYINIFKVLTLYYIIICFNILIPDKTLTFKNEKCFGGKHSKERIPLMIGPICVVLKNWNHWSLGSQEIRDFSKRKGFCL